MAKESTQKLLVWSSQNGGLQADKEARDCTGGDLFTTVPYTGAVDIRSMGAGTNVSFDYEATKSNKLVYQGDAVVVQNQKIKIEFQFNSVAFNGANKSVDFEFFLNGVAFSTFTSTIVAPANVSAFISGVVADVIAAIPTALVSGFTAPATFYGTVEIELVTLGIGTNDWTVLVDNFVHTDSGVTLEISQIITQEAISVDMLGDWHALGSDDRTGDLFQFWTTRTFFEEIPILGAADNGAGLIRITTGAHGLVGGEAVSITGVLGTTEANGIWIVDVINPTVFDLLASVFTNAYVSGGTVTSKPFGLGEIGVGVKDENNQTWTYTRLLRSKEFNFITSNQIDSRAKRKQDGNIALYFVQGHDEPKNKPRVFYYKQPYITDGALSINGGIYEYGQIAQELITFLSVAWFDIQVVGQIQTGGNILSGNWRYAFRLGTINANFTGWSYLTPVIQAGEGDEAGAIGVLFGNGAGVATSKQNILEITNPLPGLFTYVEIAAVNYLDTGFTGEIIGRYVLNGQPTQQIIHSGNELGVTDIPGSVGILQVIQPIVDTARNVELSQNRQILSDLMVNTFPDLSEWFSTFEWSLGFINLNSTGYYADGSARIAQYQIAMNTYRFLGHMLNERYAYYGVAELIDGSRTKPFFITYAIFNTDNTQPGCVAALADLNLTSTVGGDATHPRSFYIDFFGFNVDAIVDGKRIRDFVANIYIFRQEVVNKMVVASGIVIPAVNGAVAGGGAVAGAQTASWYDSAVPPVGGQLGEFPFTAGYTETAGAGLDIPLDYFLGDTSAATDFAVQRLYSSFYSWDFTNGHQSYTPQVNFDYILCYGQPPLRRSLWADTNFNDYLVETTGVTNVDPTGGTFPPTANPGFLNLAESANIGLGTSGTINALTYSKRLLFTYNYPNTAAFDAPAGFVFRTDTVGGFARQTAMADVGYFNGNQDRGVYLAQVIHPYATGVNQYGDPRDAKVIWTGLRIHIDDTTPAIYTAGLTKVFGGDTFTQKIWFKDRYPEDATTVRGFGQGIAPFAQHRTNFDMRSNAGLGTFPSANPLTAPIDWLGRTAAGTIRPPDELYYNEGYTPRNGIQIFDAFNSLAIQQTDWRNAWIWSDLEVEGSVTDNLRFFPALNLRFKDYTDGFISGLFDLNGEIIILQPSRVSREFYNTTATLTSEEGMELILGGSPVFSHKAQSLAKFGCNHKWSARVMMSDKGGSILIFYDERNKAICRIGFDGVNDLDIIHGMKSFIANYTRFIINKDKPAHSEGIHSVACQRFREFEMVFRGWRSDIPEFDAVVGYDIGVPVAFGTVGFEQIQGFYISLIDNNVFPPDDFPELWEQVPITDTNYYTFFNIVFSEHKNVFQRFSTYRPKIFFQYKDGFLAPRPVSNTGAVYEFNRPDQVNSICRFFDDGTTAQIGDPFFDAVFNHPPTIKKSWRAIRYDQDIPLPPLRTEFTTEKNISYLNQNEFKSREFEEDSPIQADSTVTLVPSGGAVANPLGLNSLRTSKLYGKYLIVRTKLQTEVYNKIHFIFIKYVERARNPNT